MVAFPHKLTVPQRPRHLITRSRLTTLLHGIVDRQLLTLTAPAGYGKTSALIDFATGEPPLPICWYTLDRFDADPWTFLAYLTEAIRQRFPEGLRQTASILEQGAPTSFGAIVTLLLQEINALDQDLAVVIDDWHLVDEVTDINELVAQILLRCPRCHMILASRRYPGLPDMMLLAARRQMSGLDEERLRFTPLEVAAVITAEYAVEVSAAQAALLAERANGWITGILLALQATEADLPALIHGSVAAEQPIYRFLGEQVFDRQPAAIQQFLLDSSLLDELTVARCTQLLGRDDARAVLDQLVRQHVFISELKPGCWRYHPLFREFLQSHFRASDPARYQVLTLRVADDYAARGEWPQAFELCVSVDDLAAAQAIAVRGGDQLYAAGRLETLERWFAELPLDTLGAPLLCLKARVLVDRGQIYEAQLLTDLAERRASDAERSGVLLQQATISRNVGRYDDAIMLCQQVLASDSEPVARAAALRTLAICQLQLAQHEQAIEHLLAALELERERGDRRMLAMIQIDLGRAYEALGKLDLAERFYSQADDHLAATGNLGERALTLNNKGVVQHLAGRYREAFATLTEASQHAQQAGIPDYEALVLASLGDLYSDLQRWQPSGAAYEQARRLSGDAFLIAYVALMHVRLLARQRRYAAADQALQRLPEAMIEQHPISALLLRGQIASGLGRDADARNCIGRALEQLQQTPVPSEQARAYLLLAQVASASNAASATMLDALDKALRVAEQVGHDAFLVAEALHMPELMRRAAALGWEQAAGWAQRHQLLLHTGRTLERVDERPLLVVRALGADQIALDDRAVEIGWLKAREVLFYLLAHPAGVPPDVLCDAIWPDLSPEKSREALRSAIYKLRSQLPRDLVVLQGRQLYRINAASVQLDYDVEHLLLLLDAGDPEDLFTACDLYGGPYLPWSDNEWSLTLRISIEQRFLQGLRAAAATCVQVQAHADALFLYRRILSVDPLDESAHAGIMRCQIALGNRAAAIDQYHRLRAVLTLELGLDPEPSSEAEQLYHDLLAAS
jgi:LuxR family transcriptional regulator, maltose regulon positive regulatory protein